MDFQVLRWKTEEASGVIRQLLVAKQRSIEKNPLIPEERTAVLLNIPPYLDKETLSAAFAKFGGVEDIFFLKRLSVGSVVKYESDSFFQTTGTAISSYKTAYVLFRSGKSVKKLIAFCSSENDPLVLSTEDAPIQSGLSTWIREHRQPLPSVVDMRKEIDVYMDKYDARVEREKLHAKANEGVADEEGWVTVTRVGKKRGVRQVDVMNETTRTAAKKKASEKELLNFYKFQKGEGKVKQLTELRRKFEEDKQKIAQMKAMRKFKPY
ncbi:ribosomal RNA-processing protein 7 homolog A-like isoform X2 [Paramacrobiotus metropolitanus]|uniref:ribosomal RNA-processing protein 7 homolog A-like isoform X2 n=1 Tax=Paramacrobiotus metropolitanus TaxID=2943436 RepID=UPI00244609DD|nr:ribosomal RNA-processing protein 7 homolog A-like isoform X2 [Paramacrobiotus metropolitanus]